MDTIGLLAAWVGVVSFLIAIVAIVAVHLVTWPFQRWWAKTSPARAEKRIQRLQADLAASDTPNNLYMADLVSLWGTMLLNLIAGVAVVMVSIQILDLAPALLASMLPFNIDSKLITRGTGIFLFVVSYFFVFRLSYLAVKIRLKTLPRKPRYAQMALKEIAELRELSGLPVDMQAESLVRGAAGAGK
jgi:hypothetical protein